MAEAVDDVGAEQNGHDGQDGDHREHQELGGLRLAVLGGNMLDLAFLWTEKKQKQKRETWKYRAKTMNVFIFPSPVLRLRCQEVIGRSEAFPDSRGFALSITLRTDAAAGEEAWADMKGVVTCVSEL
ncbi:hypothetical protein KUCAC02_033867 [Chaenocephalus aceratus]|nr:hypothetical protein KUCAC02_033867 [Chaenocephalus aceratus]